MQEQGKQAGAGAGAAPQKAKKLEGARALCLPPRSKKNRFRSGGRSQIVRYNPNAHIMYLYFMKKLSTAFSGQKPKPMPRPQPSMTGIQKAISVKKEKEKMEEAQEAMMTAQAIRFANG